MITWLHRGGPWPCRCRTGNRCPDFVPGHKQGHNPGHAPFTLPAMNGLQHEPTAMAIGSDIGSAAGSSTGEIPRPGVPQGVGQGVIQGVETFTVDAMNDLLAFTLPTCHQAPTSTCRRRPRVALQRDFGNREVTRGLDPRKLADLKQM
jgi:hypothetical protein